MIETEVGGGVAAAAAWVTIGMHHGGGLDDEHGVVTMIPLNTIMNSNMNSLHFNQ